MSRYRAELNSEAHAARTLLGFLRDQVSDLDESDDLIEDTIEGQCNLKEAVEAALQANAEDEAHATALKALVTKLSERAARKLERVQRRRFAILAAMEIAGIRKLELASGTVSATKGTPKVVVTDETALPVEFIREIVKRSPDLKAIGEALKAGNAVPGAEMSNQMPTLTVRVSA